MRRFVAVWAGQLVSSLGVNVLSFALIVYVYQQSGKVGDMALIATAAYLPHILIAPYSGVLADRLSRRMLMIAADAGSAASAGLMLLCVTRGPMGTWTAVALVAAGASCNAFQWPAYEAATVDMVPKEKLGRANGLSEFSRGASQLLAPIISGALFGVIGLAGILRLNLATFALGLLPLLVIRIPSSAARYLPKTDVTRSRIEDFKAAWDFIARYDGLVAMVALFSITNFTFAVVELLMRPLVLSFGTPGQLGVVLSTVGAGMMAGAVLMTMWGGVRRNVAAILGFQMIEGGSLMIGALRPSLTLLCAAGFAYGFVIPLTFSCARYLWQVKIPPEMQGRVAALRNAVVMLAIPLGYGASGPLTRLFEPLMAPDGALAHSAGALIGVGPGRGMALVIILMGALTCVSAVAAHSFPPYRFIERDLEDFAAIPLEGADA